MKPLKPPLIMRLPRGLREQPAWVFIGVLLFTSGLSFLLGITDSPISKAIGETGLRVWGGCLSISGLLLTAAVIKARAALEKLALRWMSCTLLAYGGYLTTVVPLNRLVMSLTLTVLLAGLAEFRVMHLKALINRADTLSHKLGVSDE